MIFEMGNYRNNVPRRRCDRRLSPPCLKYSPADTALYRYLRLVGTYLGSFVQSQQGIPRYAWHQPTVGGVGAILYILLRVPS